jgi:hypothetical protein
MRIVFINVNQHDGDDVTSNKEYCIVCKLALGYIIINSEKKLIFISQYEVAVDGHWGRWSSWSQCSATCGQGTSTRIRYCNNPPPKNGGKNCLGDNRETGVCKIKSCELGAYLKINIKPALCRINVIRTVYIFIPYTQ